jgi:hypothetical protein
MEILPPEKRETLSRCLKISEYLEKSITKMNDSQEYPREDMALNQIFPVCLDLFRECHLMYAFRENDFHEYSVPTSAVMESSECFHRTTLPESRWGVCSCFSEFLIVSLMGRRS